METADALFSRNGMVSFIEFSLKDPSAGNTVISKVAQLLPEDAQIVKVQQVSLFAQDINSQIVSFLNLWSAVIYIVVIAASYVVASRLVTEAKYELGMFRTLGAKRQAIIRLVFFHTIVVGFVGAVLGVAMGIAGAQAASTAIRWLWGNLQIYPFLMLGKPSRLSCWRLAPRRSDASILQSNPPATCPWRLHHEPSAIPIP
jgi:ABC-type lipoprotein release transport system permease subunit